MNLLCALGLVLASGLDEKLVLATLPRLGNVRGRLQQVAGQSVYVDYAHTPDALESMLKALRPHATGRLICVFGCGGNRDKGKRPLMGQIAARCADVTYVTDDNPRHEDSALIRAEILSGNPQAIEIPDRAKAIQAAIAALQAGDVLVIAGKGHETGQIVGDDVLPFDDVAVAQAALGG
jgi:UDP-N-acetylmuramoyl-L-alanyl-D-glutamate--2,6-diaminopimelate ligase